MENLAGGAEQSPRRFPLAIGPPVGLRYLSQSGFDPESGDLHEAGGLDQTNPTTEVVLPTPTFENDRHSRLNLHRIFGKKIGDDLELGSISHFEQRLTLGYKGRTLADSTQDHPIDRLSQLENGRNAVGLVNRVQKDGVRSFELVHGSIDGSIRRGQRLDQSFGVPRGDVELGD